MDQLPVELLSHVLEFLSADDLVNLQLVSKRFLALSRDNSIWRAHCFDRSPSAGVHPWAKRASATLFSSSGALLTPVGQTALNALIRRHVGSNEQGREVKSEKKNDDANEKHREGLSERARAIADWDPTYPDEQVNWYSEYIARYAPLSVNWLHQPASDETGPGHGREKLEVRGMGILRTRAYDATDKLIGPLDDGSVCIWDLSRSENGSKEALRARSESGLLFEDRSTHPGTIASFPKGKSPMDFSRISEGVSIDSIRRRSYIAVHTSLNEVDLETLQIISQEKYPWPISALSQENQYSLPLTVGTTLSVHILDTRVPSNAHNQSSSSTSSSDPTSERCESETSPIAFLPNFSKTSTIIRLRDNDFHRLLSGDRGRGALRETYAPLFQPGPLSILHPSDSNDTNSILLAGRFPSILVYDRRHFPRLQKTIHSGASLCGLTHLPYPPRDETSQSRPSESHDTQTLIACGEYKGRGSLELYSLPSSSDHQTLPPLSTLTSSSSSSAIDEYESVSQESDKRTEQFTYRNRQTASRAKLLSIATHGTRLVFSDAEGGLKWVERDGHTLVRRWNINAFQWLNVQRNSTSNIWGRGLSTLEAGTSGGDVVRKTIPTGGELDRDELLVWTGEKVGRLRFVMKPDDEEDAASEGKEKNEEEYAKVMRRALERQADEARWMTRLGL